MHNTKVRQCYKAFGLCIISDIVMPELIPSHMAPNEAELHIIIDTALQSDIDINDDEYIVRDKCVTMRMAGAGLFRISEGSEIRITPAENSDEGLIRLYILGTCMGIIMLQRSILPLHGSAVTRNGKVYAIVGESGAGKSTLTSALLEQGFELLSDDIVPIQLNNPEDIPTVLPTYPQQKLWQQSLDMFDMDNSQLRPIFGRATKYCISVKDKYCEDQLPLAGIFELSKSEAPGVHINELSKLMKLPLLFQHTFRHYLIPRLNILDWHFNITARLSQQLPVYRIIRSEQEYSIPQLVDLLLAATALEETDNGK